MESTFTPRFVVRHGSSSGLVDSKNNNPMKPLYLLWYFGRPADPQPVASDLSAASTARLLQKMYQPARSYAHSLRSPLSARLAMSLILTVPPSTLMRSEEHTSELQS